MEKVVIVFDCGATNLRAVAINTRGEIVATHSVANHICIDPNYENGLIWDVNEIWEKLCNASRDVLSRIDKNLVIAVTTTTFGVDGALLDEAGNLLYPVISWQCKRTEAVMNKINNYIPLTDLYKISGVHMYSFNTINKLIWLKENHPDIVSKAHRFLFLPSLINYFLTGKMYNDITMLGTSMLSDLTTRTLSSEIMNRIGFKSELFGNIGESGDIIGEVTDEAAQNTGIPPKIPVCLTGHDTQFAVYGSGADTNQVVLSSGTWEILMTRSKYASATDVEFQRGITTELDAECGLYNIGLNWLGSGIVEWVRKVFYLECSNEDCYDIMVDEATTIPCGSNGIVINPDFIGLTNVISKGQILGLTMHTTRAEIIRSTIEALSYQTKRALQAIEDAGNFKTQKVICVGGGSKNRLWNQIRADVLNIPVEVIQQKETTVLGASFFAFAAVGEFSSPQEAKNNINYDPEMFYPSVLSEQYQKLYYIWLDLIQQK